MVAILKGYREWTEELGSDREWKIQLVQASIEKIASEEAAKCNSFYVPHRKDVLIFLANGVEEECLREVISKIEKVSPVPVETSIGCGSTPLSALRGESRKCEGSDVAVVHIDLNYFSKDEIYSAYVRAMNNYSTLLNLFLGVGGIGAYLGGDNFVFFIDPKDLHIIDEVKMILKDAKIGVGIGKNPREALSKAASSLKFLRENRNLRSYLIQ